MVTHVSLSFAPALGRMVCVRRVRERKGTSTLLRARISRGEKAEGAETERRGVGPRETWKKAEEEEL
eukprot:747453-Hanusia_phi.AAC.3